MKVKERVEGVEPFSYIDIYSPEETKEHGVIAHGQLRELKGYCIYLGPADHGDEIPAGEKRYSGPIVNHGKPAGDNKAVVKQVDFDGQDSVYISRAGSPPGKFGVWERVRGRT